MSVLRDAIKHLLSKPSTVEYPKTATLVEADYRGAHYPDLNRCVGCSLCMINCPSQCISMERLPEGVQLKHNRRGVFPVVDYRSCVFCYRCVKVCPFGAFVTTNEYRLAVGGREAVSSRRASLSTIGR